MSIERDLIANFIQTLARAVELSEHAHDYAPEHLAITLRRDPNTMRSQLRIECDGSAVAFDPDHQRLASVFGLLRIKERTDAV